MSKVVPQVLFRQHFGYDVEEASNAATRPVETYGESLTVQSMAEDADLNVILKRFGVTGKLPENPRVPMYGDFTGVKDFQSALAAVQAASDMFMEFPAEVRARFGNDPQQLLEFCEDVRNREEGVKLGLFKPVVDAPAPAEYKGMNKPSETPAVSPAVPPAK